MTDPQVIVVASCAIPSYAITFYAAAAMFLGILFGYLAGSGGGSTVRGSGGTM